MKATAPLALILLATLQPAVPAQQEAKPAGRVARVYVVGNTITRDDVIRAFVDVYPGQALDRASLAAAEQRLARSGLFGTDPPPSIQILDDDPPSQFKDILVKVEDHGSRQLCVEGCVSCEGHPIVRLMLRDANGDLLNWPGAWADVVEDRAFRGGGQKLNLELLRFDLVDLRLHALSVRQLLPTRVQVFRGQ